MKKEAIMFAKEQILAGKTVQQQLVSIDENGEYKHCAVGWILLKLGMTVEELQIVDEFGLNAPSKKILNETRKKVRKVILDAKINPKQLFKVQRLNDEGKTKELLKSLTGMCK